MPASRTAALIAAQAALFTQPGWLLAVGELNRWCSRGDLTILGTPWLGADFSLQGLGAGGNLAAGGQVTWFDPDDALVTLVLADQLADAPARVWLYDAAALDDADPMEVFSGVLDAVDYDPARREITATLSLPIRQPWPHYGPALGMNHAMPAGTQLRVGADTWVVERPR